MYLRSKAVIAAWAIVLGSMPGYAASDVPPATRASRESPLRVRLTLDGKPYRGCVFVLGKTLGGRLFCPEEGGVIPKAGGGFSDGIEGPLDLSFVNIGHQSAAYAAQTHLDSSSGTVTLALKEIPWVPTTVVVRDEHGLAIVDRRIKIVQTVSRNEAWEQVATTDKEGKAAFNCVAGAVYHVVCGRPLRAIGVISKDFTTDDLTNGVFTFVVPTLEAASFRFRLVVRGGQKVEHLEDVRGCEVTEVGWESSIDGVFYLQPTYLWKDIYVEGKTLHLRLSEGLSRQYEFADQKGLLVFGKLGEMKDVELVPRVRHRLQVSVSGPDALPLGRAAISYRRAGSGTWQAATGALEDLLPGKYEVVAWVPEYLLGRQEVESSAGKVSFVLQRGPLAQVAVRRADDKPLGQASLRIYYADSQVGPAMQRSRLESGRAVIGYDPAYHPVLTVVADGATQALLALGKDAKAYDIVLPTIAPTKVTLAATDDPKFPKPALLKTVTWVSTMPARLRVGRTELKDGAGEISLAPGEYLPIFEYVEISVTPSDQMHSALVCEPVKITGQGGALKLVPSRVVSRVSEVMDGLHE